MANMFSTYSSLIGFVVGAALYYVLAKYWWFKKYPQTEMIDPDDAKYLGITVGRDWEIVSNETPVLVPEPVRNVSQK